MYLHSQRAYYALVRSVDKEWGRKRSFGNKACFLYVLVRVRLTNLGYPVECIEGYIVESEGLCLSAYV